MTLKKKENSQCPNYAHTTVISNFSVITTSSCFEFCNNHQLPPPFKKDEDGVRSTVGYLCHSHFLPLPGSLPG